MQSFRVPFGGKQELAVDFQFDCFLYVFYILAMLIALGFRVYGSGFRV